MDGTHSKTDPKPKPPPELPPWPQKVWDVFRCPECGAGLVKTKGGRRGYWTCNRPAGIGNVHVGLIPEYEIVIRLDAVLDPPREDLAALWRRKKLNPRVVQLRKTLALARRLSKLLLIPTRKGRR